MTREDQKNLSQWASVNAPWHLIEQILQERICSTIYLSGTPGVGKTFLALQAGRAGKTFNQTLNEDLAVQELMGVWAPSANGITWTPGPIIQAMENGGMLILNEIHRASAAVQDFLLGVLDNSESAGITLPTGRYVPRSSDLIIVATANEGIECLSPALASRFEISMILPGPNPALIARLDSKINGLGKLVENSYSDPDSEPISPRAALSFARLASRMDSQKAAMLAFGTRAPDILAALKALGDFS